MSAPGHIRKGLVDRQPLHQGCVVADDLDSGIAQPLVLAEMAPHECELWTQLPRVPPGHTTTHAEGSRLIGRSQHDAAPDGDRSSTQGRIEQLLDGGIERVEVGMEDSGFHRAPSGLPQGLRHCLYIQYATHWSARKVGAARPRSKAIK